MELSVRGWVVARGKGRSEQRAVVARGYPCGACVHSHACVHGRGRRQAQAGGEGRLKNPGLGGVVLDRHIRRGWRVASSAPSLNADYHRSRAAQAGLPK